MAYDPADGYVLFFGGSTDIWTFAHGIWTHLTSSVHPPGISPSMTYDAADGYVVLFGGSQTWTFLHGTWTNITPATITPTNEPSPRLGPSFTYDTKDGYAILFGGEQLKRFYNDTWRFRAGVWTNITATSEASPPCRFGASMADDSSEGYVVLFGGAGKEPGGCGADVKNRTLADTWRFSGGKWTQLHPTQSPPACWKATMAFDAADDYAVLFGGIDTSDMALQETWKYASGNWSIVPLETYPPTSPPARFAATMVYDAGDGYVLLFGGLSEPRPDAPLLGDVWTFHDSVWTNLTANPIPPFRTSMAMTYDQEDGYVLLFGGTNASGPLGDTWKFVGGVWLKLRPPESPPARYGASIAYNAITAKVGYVLLFGGVGASGLLGDTWEFVLGKWTNHTVATPNATNTPGPRYDAAMAFDANPKVRAVVLFGGDGPSGVLADTWLFVKGRWSLESSSPSPPARAGAAMAYDGASHNGNLLLFGGIDDGTIYGDTWEFTSGDEWTQVVLSAGSSPSPRYAADLVFDASSGHILLFGGANASSVLNDTWTFGQGAWTRLSVSPSPSGRAGAGMTYDAADSLVLLFSGTRATTSALQTDTWVFSNDSWTNISQGPIRLSATTGGTLPQEPGIESLWGRWVGPSIRRPAP